MRRHSMLFVVQFLRYQQSLDTHELIYIFVTSIFLEWIKRSLPMGCCKNIASEVSFAALLFFLFFYLSMYDLGLW